MTVRCTLGRRIEVWLWGRGFMDHGYQNPKTKTFWGSLIYEILK